MNRFYKMLVSVFVFLSFIYPLKDVKKSDFKLENSVSTTEIQVSPYENMIKEQILETLENNGFSGCDITVEAEMNTKGEIIINKAEIAVPWAYKKKEVKDIVSKEIGINARVINIGD